MKKEIVIILTFILASFFAAKFLLNSPKDPAQIVAKDSGKKVQDWHEMKEELKILEPKKTVVVPVRDEPSHENVDMEERLMTGLTADPEIQQIAEVISANCTQHSCSVSIEAKDPEKNVQMSVLKFIQDHPEFGNKFTINESKEDNRITLFTFSRDEK